MAWLSTPGAWIEEESSVRTEGATFATATGPVAYVRDVTVVSKHAGALTKAAADTLAASVRVEKPTATASVQRQNAGGAYRVVVVEPVGYGAWRLPT